MFGNPLIAFALQAALLEGERMPLAYSALALAAVYALLAAVLIRRERMRLLGESFAVLAVGFATLAVPLALSARSTACTFALEGAALVWLGFRQQRRLPRWSGIALQILAAGAFLASLAFAGGNVDTIAIANGGCISAVLIAGAALTSAWLYAHNGANAQFASLLYFWGLAWWIGAGLREIDRFVPVHLQVQALLGFVALTLWPRRTRVEPRATPRARMDCGHRLAAASRSYSCLRARTRARSRDGASRLSRHTRSRAS